MRARLANAFAKRDDPYAGVDLANASRFGGAVWLCGAAVTLLLLPFVHPTAELGSAGWIVAAVVVIGALAAGMRMRTAGSHVNVDEMLVYSYLAIACIASVVWLTGGMGSPYGQLYILGGIYTVAVHPPRRVRGYMLAFVLLVLAPIAYHEHATRREVLNLVTELFVWLALLLVVGVLMGYIRAQRVGLRAEGERARRQARVDQLTDLLNRRAFDEDLGQAVEFARSAGLPLSLLVADLDGFKDFNDRYGHLEGDAVLKNVAAALRSAVRRPDITYRWGGDEFAVILSHTDIDGARVVAARVRAAVAAAAGPDGQKLAITAGVAEYDADDERGPAALVEAADLALIQEKGAGSVEVSQTRR